MPARSASSASASAEYGVSLAGRTTIGQPAASAAAALRVIMAEGKFQGVTAADDADRLAPDDHLPARQMRRDALDVDALGLLGEPLDEARRIGDLALGLRQRLALLQRHDQREVVLRRDHQVVPAAQECRALLRQKLAPGGESGGRGIDRGLGLGDARCRHNAQCSPVAGLVTAMTLPSCAAVHLPPTYACSRNRRGSFSSRARCGQSVEPACASSHSGREDGSGTAEDAAKDSALADRAV